MAEAIPVPSKKLHGKVAIVTGAASGIGAVTTRHLADYRARMVVIADVQDTKGREVAAAIGSDRCTYVHCDVTDEDQVKSLIDSTVGQYGQLDVMFSNAGIIAEFAQTVLELDFSRYDRVMAVNSRGMAACVKHASCACDASGVGAGEVSEHAAGGAWSACDSVSPGMVGTQMVADTFKIGAEEVKEMLAAVYKGRDGPLMEKHVADTVVFLACEDSAFVTGHNLVVDGGVGTGMNIISASKAN
ncbi:hypothetical protein ACLB2K_053513 [Fragaria x ananassa]